MPLSEDEQRILQQIEQQFHASDPRLAGDMGKHSVYGHCLRQMRWAGVVFGAGLAVLLVSLYLGASFFVSFGGFVVMLAAALWFERSVRKMGRAGIAQLSSSLKAGGLRDYFGDTGDRVRSRLRREGDEQVPDDDAS